MCSVHVCLCMHVRACMCVRVCVLAMWTWADVYVGRSVRLCLCVCKFVTVRFLLHALLCQHCHSACLHGQAVGSRKLALQCKTAGLLSVLREMSIAELQAC